MEFQKPKEMPNGIAVYTLPIEKFKTVSVRVVFQRQLGEEAAANALVSAIVQRGCEPWPTTTLLSRYLDSLYGAYLGGGVQKTGEQQTLEFALSILNDRFFPTERLLERGLGVLGSVIVRPVLEGGAFRHDYFRQEQENLRQRIRSLINDKRRYAVFRAIQAMCANEPFSTYKYGREDEVVRLTPEKLYSHYQRVLNSGPVTVFVVGDIVPEVIFEWAEKVLLPHKVARPQLPRALVNVPVHAVKEIVEEEQVQQSTLVLGFRTYTSYNDPDYYAQIMASGILGAFPHSKLFLNVRERASLAYYVYSHYESSKGILLVNAGIDADKYGRALGIISDQVNAMQEGDITDAELEATRHSLATAWQSMDDNPDQMIDSAVVGLVNGRMPSTERSINAINTVSRDDVVQAARKWRLDTTYFLRPKL